MNNHSFSQNYRVKCCLCTVHVCTSDMLRQWLFFFRKTRRCWWGGHGDWKSCGYTGITDSTSSLSVFVRLLFYFVVFFFFGGDKQVAHLACHTWQLTDEFSLALISCRPTCDVVASCNWKCFAIRSIGFPAHLRLIAHILKFARNTHQTGAIFNHFTCKYRSNRLTGVCT